MITTTKTIIIQHYLISIRIQKINYFNSNNKNNNNNNNINNN